METRKVTPCGMLHTFAKSYFLLHPYPIAKDSWQDDSMHRFRVVPNFTIGEELQPDGNKYMFVYPHERHIVIRGQFIIDYSEVREILVQKAEYDLVDIPAPEVLEASDNNV